MCLGESLGQAMEEAIELTGMQLREAISFGLCQAIAGQHDPVVLISAHNKSAGAIHDRGLRRIVVCGKEFGETIPAAVPRWPDRMTHAVLDGQFLGDFPTILN